MNYSEFNFSITPCNDISREILSAELSDLGFEGFLETENGFTAYIISTIFNASATSNIIDELKENKILVTFETKEITPQNWNEEWEKNAEPVLIGDNCVIKTPFHLNVPPTKYEILIEPKMSFGTGHHETTSLMVEEMLLADFSKKHVLDLGCGTSVLAILASKLGAKKILAIDNDSWAYENSLENIKLNAISNIKVLEGTSDLINEEKFDIILANIIKNIILSDAQKIASALHNNGMLFCSGFYETDIEDIQSAMKQNGLTFISFKTKNNWAILQFVKKSKI